MSGRLPNYVIVGAQKSGTSSLCRYLDAHSEAFCGGELRYFTTNHDRGLEWYRTQFADAGDAVAVGEKTPDYMYTPLAVERMAATLPDAKLIAILRNPVDRAYSHYWHRRRERTESRSFEEVVAIGLAARPSGRGADLSTTDLKPGLEYVRRSQYLPHLEGLREFYPRSSLLVLLFEDLQSRPAQTFAEACRFLGILDTETPAVVGRKVNQYRGYRSWRLVNQMYRRRLWRFLPGGSAKLAFRLLRRRAEYPPMSPETRARLSAGLAEDNAALAGWLGRDLSVWQT